MKKLFSIFLMLNSLCIYAQPGLYVNGSLACLRVDSSGFLSIEGDFSNLDCDPVLQVRFNGPLYLAGNLHNNDTLKFSATTGAGNSKKARIIFRNSVQYPAGNTASISGVAAPRFWEVELDKPGGSLIMNNHVRCLDTLSFVNGFIFMNGYSWSFVDPVGAVSVMNHPFIRGERNLSQFLPASLLDSGKVIYRTVFSSSVGLNPANIGIALSGLLDEGSGFDVVRGFKTQVNAGKTSIHRYFDLYSPAYSLTGNTVAVRYHQNDMSYFSPGFINLQALRLFVSRDGVGEWSPLRSTLAGPLVNSPGPVADGLMQAALNDLAHPHIGLDGRNFRITIADPDCNNPPVSSLLADTVHVCGGDSLVLDAGNVSALPNTLLRWEWQISPPVFDRTISVRPDTAYHCYRVSLMDVRGCVTIDSVVLAPAAPFPQITYLNHLNACLGDSATIKDTVRITTGSFTNAWIFSDGDSSNTLQNQFRKKYSAAGRHAFQLSVTSDHGCVTSRADTTVITYPLPTAAFAGSLNCLTNVVSFTNNSVSNYSTLVISSAHWNFGRGLNDTSTFFSAATTYTAGGSYSVSLRVSSSFGCRDSVSSPFLVYPRNLPAFTKNNACLGDTVFLDNLSTCNTGSCTYTWDTGDGNMAVGANLQKLYNNPGLYQVKLKVTAPVGCADSINTAVFINARPVSQFSLSAQDLCPNSSVYASNASAINAGSIVANVWDFGNGNVSFLYNGSTSYSLPGVYTVSLTAVSDSGCVDSETLTLTVHAQPQAAFSVNNVCQGLPSQFISTSTGTNLAGQWYYGNSVISQTTTLAVQNYIYPSAGSYTATFIVSDIWGCSDTASSAVSVLARPVAGLGGTVSTCGSSLTLDAGNTGSVFMWMPLNQNTQTITALNSGTYQVLVTAQNGCSSQETVSVTLNSIVKPALGSDTTVCGSFLLDAGYPGSIFLWSQGGTAQTLLVTGSGTYAVNVTDQNGCSGGDTIAVTIQPPAIVSLGSDLSICKPPAGYTLSAAGNPITYTWSTGASSPSVSVLNSGAYWLKASAPNGCVSADTINITFLNTPAVDLGPDRTVCGGVWLDARNAGCSYTWNDGRNDQVLYAEETRVYQVTVTNTTTGCSASDSLFVLAHPNVTVSLGNDTSVCSNTGFSLDAGNPGSTYRWSDNSTGSTLPLAGSGVYGVTVTSAGGCYASDYIQVSVQQAPEVRISSRIRYICAGKPVELRTTNTESVSWFTEYGLTGSSPVFMASQPGKHWLDVMAYGCKSSDTIVVLPSNNTIQAQFLASTLDTVNRPVKFVNLSMPVPVSQTWYFGDGLTSTDQHPVHTYVLPEHYNVTLEVSNGYCSDRITKAVQVIFRQRIAEPSARRDRLELLCLNAYPNPASQILHLDITFNIGSPLELRLSDLSGRLIRIQKNEEALEHRMEFGLDEFARGLYFLSIHAEGMRGEVRRTVKFIKN